MEFHNIGTTNGIAAASEVAVGTVAMKTSILRIWPLEGKYTYAYKFCCKLPEL
jgi:hypothetical protein